MLLVSQTTKHTHVKQWSVWSKLPDVPCSNSSVCVVDKVLLAIGGTEYQSGLVKMTCVNAFCHVDQKWLHVGDMPNGCSRVDTLLLSDGRLLMVDRFSRSVLRINVQGTCIFVANEIVLTKNIYTGLAMQAEQR